jgi:hypothetical protein
MRRIVLVVALVGLVSSLLFLASCSGARVGVGVSVGVPVGNRGYVIVGASRW